MNKNAMTLSLVMAAVAVFFVMSYVSNVEQEAKDRFGDEIMVLVAKSDIKEMSTLTDGMFDIKSVPKKFVEPTAVSFEGNAAVDSPEFKKEVMRINGNVAIVPIRTGEQIAWNKITEPSLRTGLAPQVAIGKRAISIPAGEIEAVGKLVKPGDRVDIIAVLEVGSGSGGREDKVAKTIMQDVVILAIGRNITNNIPRKMDVDGKKINYKSLNEYDGFSSITIEVDPNQAQLLAAILAGSSNKLMLSLRNNDDTDRVSFQGVRAQDAFNAGARTPAQNQGGR
jgi:pilus assembly protein CpaB